MSTPKAIQEATSEAPDPRRAIALGFLIGIGVAFALAYLFITQ